MLTPTAAERVLIGPLLTVFDSSISSLALFHDTVQRTISSSKELKPLIHSMRARIKDRDHLQDKLLRKMRECKEQNKPFEVTPENLLVTINDLAGIRLLHLHTAQAQPINEYLTGVLRANGYNFLEGPVARTWDIEREKIFKEMGFETKQSENLYTSVHYVISDQVPGLIRTCELQVRTLSEELWGEVDHKLNYPHKTKSVACIQQIRALAHSTSAAGRLADSIFATVADEAARSSAISNRKRKTRKRRPTR